MRKDSEGAAERMAAWAKAGKQSHRKSTYFSYLHCVFYVVPVFDDASAARKPIGCNTE